MVRNKPILKTGFEDSRRLRYLRRPEKSSLIIQAAFFIRPHAPRKEVSTPYAQLRSNHVALSQRAEGPIPFRRPLECPMAYQPDCSCLTLHPRLVRNHLSRPATIYQKGDHDGGVPG